MTEFDIRVPFLCEVDNDRSSSWKNDRKNFLITYYYNDENVDLNKILEKLNILAINLNLYERVEKKLFTMQICRPGSCNTDFSAKFIFSTTK